MLLFVLQTIEVEIKCPDHVQVGSDVMISTSYKNKSGQQMTVEGKLFVDVISYTGKTVSTCKEDDISSKLATYDSRFCSVILIDTVKTCDHFFKLQQEMCMSVYTGNMLVHTARNRSHICYLYALE